MSASSVPVVMPRLGESIVEGTVVSWRVGPGDEIDRGSVIAEVETDKATSEILAPAAGRIAEILVPAGTTVEVGTPLARIESVETRTRDAAGPPPPPTRPASERASDGPPSAAPTSSPPPSTPPETGRLSARRLAPRPVGPDGGPARSSPAVRRLAREHGLDLHRIEGTGSRGRVTKQDVLTALGPPAPARATGEVPPAGRAYRLPVYAPTPADTVEPFSRRRAQIADHMTTSLATAAHVVAVTEVDMKAVLTAKRVDAAHPAAASVELSLTAYLVHALAQTLSEHPRLNASVRDRELVLRGERNIGVAVDAPSGLVVPVIHRADELGLIGIARRLRTLVEAARSGGLTPEMTAGGSFTLSNPGPDGNLFGVSIIRQPEVAILRVGAVVKRAVVRTIDDEDAIVIRPMMYAALSYDHRVIDGRVGNAFLRSFVSRLEAARPHLGGVRSWPAS